jgi:hypothetical protein
MDANDADQLWVFVFVRVLFENFVANVLKDLATKLHEINPKRHEKEKRPS